MKGMHVGMSATCTRTFTEDDRAVYRSLARDESDDLEVGRYKLPEPLIAGMFSFILGTELPGFGANYLKQGMNFIKQAYFGEPLTVTVTVVRLRPDKNLVNLETTCHNAQRELVCSGEALVLAKDVQDRSL
ncbi:MAG: phosphate acetyltransferase [Burkholderiales bacterium]|nr:phosphate acetyltransferase [Burkholderiales bacterium]